jgi:Kelch motif
MAGTWQPLANQPGFNTSTMILLTDGRVMVQEEGTPRWHTLKPDAHGSYVNGSWSSIKDMSFWRRYYVSAVLLDGRVLICGGEQTGDGEDTNKGEIYDPVADTWTNIAAPTWTQVGDAASCALPDGRVLIGALLSGDCMIYDPAADSWASAAVHSGRTNEESWILLPDNTIVTVQCFTPFRGQKYVISNDTWQDEGAVPVTLVDPVMHEVGPAMLLYTGDVIFFGSANSNGYGKTALYKPPATPTGVGSWAAGPDIPNVGGQVMVCNDCPATLLPDGKVLVTGAQFQNNNWGSPVYFFEYDPVSNTIVQAPTPPNNAMFPYPANPGLYWSRMMLLPTGQVLFSASSGTVQCYTPGGLPAESWRPTISSIQAHGVIVTDYLLLQGTQLNGLSQANIYGDDVYPATNYPIVRLENTVTNDVYFGRTYAFSTLAVATGAALQSCRVDMRTVPNGTYDVTVIANGISSHPVQFGFRRQHKPDLLDGRNKWEFEITRKEIVEGDPWKWWERVVDPQIGELRSEVTELREAVRTLKSLIKTAQLPEVGKRVAKAAQMSKTDIAKQRYTDETPKK